MQSPGGWPQMEARRVPNAPNNFGNPSGYPFQDNRPIQFQAT